MLFLYLTPASISYLNQLLLSLLITGYLLHRFRQHRQLLLQDRLLLFFFLGITLFSLALFLDVSLLPSESLLMGYAQNPILALLLIFLMQFAYVFPNPRENQKVERSLALIFTILYMLAEVGFAFWRFYRLGLGKVEYRHTYFEYPLLISFLWVVFVFARGTVQNWRFPSSRRFALIFFIPLYLATLNVLVANFNVVSILYHISMSVGILSTIFLFILNYLASRPEATSLLVKISGIALTSSLAIFGVIPWLVAPAYVERYTPKIPDQRSIRFSPNLAGGYDVTEIPFHFEEDLGENLELTVSPFARSEVRVDGFSFPFYGHRYEHLYIINNGIIVFGRDIEYRDLEYHFANVPAIFPLLVNLNPEIEPEGGVFLRHDPSQLVITNYRVPAYYRPGREFTFQVILYADGTFDLNYHDLPQTIPYYVNERPDAAPWAVGAQPGGSTPQRVDFFADVPLRGGPHGMIQDEYRAYRRYLHNFLFPLAVASLASSILLAVGVPLLLNVLVARPLNALLKGVSLFNQGQRTQHIPIQFNDEIGFLTLSFNNLGEELDSVIKNLERRVAERTFDLVAANEQLRKLSSAVEQSPSVIMITDWDANIEYVNPAFTRSTGYVFEDVTGKNPRFLKSNQTSPETYTDLWATLTAGKTWRGELCNRRRDGSDFWEYTVISPIYDGQGAVTHYVAVKEDITIRKLTELSLQESEKQYRDLFELESDAIFVIRNRDGVILEANSAATVLYGYSHAELVRMHNTDMSAEPEATQKATHSPIPIDQVVMIPLRWHRKKDGTVFPVEITARFITWKGEDVHLAAIRDISEHKRIEEELNQLAITDPLTKLANRRHFFAEAQKIFLRAKHPPYELSALMMDIDHFKQINDTYGHPIGDLILQEVASRIQTSLRPVDLLGRYGGEEFIALVSRTHFADVCQIADRLLKSVNEATILAKGQVISVTISLGIAPLKETTNSIDELVSNADQALYLAKDSGRNRWEII